MSYSNIRRSPSFMEKLIAAASYVFPLVGFVTIILAVLMKTNLKPFLKYHVFQSMFIAFGLTVIVYGLSLVMNLLSAIPLIKNLISLVTFFLTTQLFFGFSVVTFVYFVFVMYLIAGVIRGSDSYVPWVSDIIKYNVRG